MKANMSEISLKKNELKGQAIIKLLWGIVEHNRKGKANGCNQTTPVREANWLKPLWPLLSRNGQNKQPEDS